MFAGYSFYEATISKDTVIQLPSSGPNYTASLQPIIKQCSLDWSPAECVVYIGVQLPAMQGRYRYRLIANTLKTNGIAASALIPAANRVVGNFFSMRDHEKILTLMKAMTELDNAEEHFVAMCQLCHDADIQEKLPSILTTDRSCSAVCARYRYNNRQKLFESALAQKAYDVVNNELQVIRSFLPKRGLNIVDAIKNALDAGLLKKSAWSAYPLLVRIPNKNKRKIIVKAFLAFKDSDTDRWNYKIEHVKEFLAAFNAIHENVLLMQDIYGITSDEALRKLHTRLTTQYALLYSWFGNGLHELCISILGYNFNEPPGAMKSRASEVMAHRDEQTLLRYLNRCYPKNPIVKTLIQKFKDREPKITSKAIIEEAMYSAENRFPPIYEALKKYYKKQWLQPSEMPSDSSGPDSPSTK